ncbi:MAG: HlyD family type I secretion periplasmic adaptor subunit [Bosea sp. (in: a-proteobacteria)]
MTAHADLAGNRRSIRRGVLAGTAAIALLVGVVGGWATTTDVSGAVMAPGRLVVDSHVKKVQHLTGGIVGELLVEEGAMVKRGDVLVRLDETMIRANLAIVLKSLDQFTARRARLASERDGLVEVAYPSELTARSADPTAAEAMRGEERLFELRRDLRGGRKAQLAQRVEQLSLEIDGMERQKRSKARQLSLIQEELKRVGTLYEKNLIEVTKLISLEREQAELSGLEGNLAAQIAQAQGKIAETRLQILAIDQEMAEQVAAEMRDVEGKIAEYVERRIAAEDQLKRVEIIAPQDGVVHQLALHTVGGVVPTTEPVALIVPVDDRLTVEARVQPQDVDQLQLHQPAMLRFSAFNQRTTPELAGRIQRIAADVSFEPQTGASFYVVRIRIEPGELVKLGELKLVPGMPVETFIRTGERSVASYFIKPLQDQLERAFRET